MKASVCYNAVQRNLFPVSAAEGAFAGGWGRMGE